MITEAQIESINKTILKRYPECESIWLYGSQAKGTSTALSDVDVCVKMSEGTKVNRYDTTLNYELLKQVGKVVSVVFCTIKNEWMLKLIHENKISK